MPVPSPDQIQPARDWLAAADPALNFVHRVTPEFEWRVRPGGFSGLLQMVVEQQLSTLAAAAIWSRFEADMGDVTPANVLAADERALRALGFSGQKVRYAHALARADFDFPGLARLDDEEAVAALVALKGIGRWTAELYLLFCEARLDVFPAGDLALQEGLRMGEGGEARLNEKGLYARAEAWRPYRGVAAHLLWRYYAGVKKGELPLHTM